MNLINLIKKFYDNENIILRKFNKLNIYSIIQFKIIREIIY